LRRGLDPLGGQALDVGAREHRSSPVRLRVVMVVPLDPSGLRKLKQSAWRNAEGLGGSALADVFWFRHELLSIACGGGSGGRRRRDSLE
jgi:hypothetical protein